MFDHSLLVYIGVLKRADLEIIWTIGCQVFNYHSTNKAKLDILLTIKMSNQKTESLKFEIK